MKNIPDFFVRKAYEVDQFGGDFYVVGGAVRDYIMGKEPKDYDFVVSGIDIDTAKAIFGTFEPIHPKAPVYGVFVDGTQYEVAYPRKEVSTGFGKQDFEFVVTHDIFEDAVRRDFTMNAIYYHIVRDEYVDYFGGIDDIKYGVIRHSSIKFSESPERIYRAIAFVARFGFSIAPETIDEIKQMVIRGAVSQIPVEQVWKQGYSKIFVGRYFYEAFSYMIECGFAPQEIVDMVDCPQPAKYHPEGDVFTHSCFSATYMSDHYQEHFGISKSVAVAISFAHDMGKPETTKVVNEKITAYGHEDSEVPYQFFAKIGFPVAMIEVAKTAIKGHMTRFESGSKKEVAKFARKAGNYVNFCFAVIMADCMARAEASYIPESVIFAEDCAKEMIEVKTFESFVTGSEIMVIKGIKPSKMVGVIKEAVIEAQISGEVTTKEEAIEFVKQF